MIPFIPETAPFDADQRLWLNGYMAGLLAGKHLVPANANGTGGGGGGRGGGPSLEYGLRYQAQSFIPFRFCRLRAASQLIFRPFNRDTGSDTSLAYQPFKLGYFVLRFLKQLNIVPVISYMLLG